ncbi:hypothetical protein YC2023_022114 [Brassica napus]
MSSHPLRTRSPCSGLYTFAVLTKKHFCSFDPMKLYLSLAPIGCKLLLHPGLGFKSQTMQFIADYRKSRFQVPERAVKSGQAWIFIGRLR